MPVWDNISPYQQQVYASAARTATPTAVQVTNKGNFPIAMLFVSCTAEAGASESVVFTFHTYNKLAGTWNLLLTSAAVTGVSENVYQIGGVGTAVASVSTALHPGSKLRVTATHGNTDSITYSVAVSWLRN